MAGSLQGKAGVSYSIDLYVSADADPTGYGEGETYLGSVAAIAGSNGNASFSVSKSYAGSSVKVTATATASGGDTSEFSQAITATNAPSGPANLDAVALSSTRMRLTWTDTSSDEQYFYIYRREGSGAWQYRFRVGSNVQVAEEGGLQRGATYTYRVRTWNGSFYSPYSNEDTESTPVLPSTSRRAATIARTGGRRK